MIYQHRGLHLPTGRQVDTNQGVVYQTHYEKETKPGFQYFTSADKTVLSLFLK
jgi:hypothetical protein